MLFPNSSLLVEFLYMCASGKKKTPVNSKIDDKFKYMRHLTIMWYAATFGTLNFIA